MLKLNNRAATLCDEIARNADTLRVASQWTDSGTELWDFGIDTAGGLEAGQYLARICMAGLGQVGLVPGNENLWHGPAIQVATDQPVAACMASQYAGWEINHNGFFAMGSGPIRAVAEVEPLFDEIGYHESANRCFGVLESGKLPTDAVCRYLAEQCGMAPDRITLFIAPTSSQAGNVQVVARSVETALHKLHELEFDLSRIESGWGVAPLPPVAADDLAGIGRTNDAILYGGEAVLYVRGDDASLERLGPKIPSSSSADYGRPFADIFAEYKHDFYSIDRGLFSTAVITFVNLDTGNTHHFGNFLPEVLHKSFGG